MLTKYLLILVLFASCTKEPQRGKPIVNSILILGNSIVQHGYAPSLGWNNNWGMAATSIDSDFVHILIRNVSGVNATAKVDYLNISEFEGNYSSFDFHRFDTLKKKHPEMIVMRISENVNDVTARTNNFIKYYDSLINYIDTTHKASVIITNGFWPASNVNPLIEEYATQKNYPFVKLNDLYFIAEQTAAGQFANTGVAAHPSNKGMKSIAGRIWEKMKLGL